MQGSPADACLGVAAHSLRAVTPAGLELVQTLATDGPIHIHIAEQTAEVEAVQAAYGKRPVRWLMDHVGIDERWCLVHATHLTDQETVDLAESGAIAGLCPITEANLGDGIFPGRAFLDAGGKIAVGSDSNVFISLTEELRLLEYSQRLQRRQRSVLADDQRSCGRLLLEETAKHSAQAVGRDAGEIRPGALADLIALDLDSAAFDGLAGDQILDAWIFACPRSAIIDVWSAGRHVVRGGQHIQREAIDARFRATMATLRCEL